MGLRHRLRTGLWVAGVLLCGVSFMEAQESDAARMFATIQREVQSVFAKCQSSVVRIEANDDHGRLSGTGFFIDPNGTLYTSYSVGGETRDISVTFGTTHYPATRIVSDLRSGVAILKIEAETPFLSFARPRGVALASPAMAIGYPMDLPACPSFGMVCGFDIKYLGRFFATTHIRANVAVQRGEGGAPLLNLRGEVVGILISSLDQGSASFALPIEAAEKIRHDFRRFNQVRRGWLGLQVGAVPAAVAGSSAQVLEVLPGSPGVKAGLKKGDVLLQVGERPIATPEDVLDASFYLTAEDEVTVRIARGSKTIDLKVQPSEHPDEPTALTRLAPADQPPQLHFQPAKTEP